MLRKEIQLAVFASVGMGVLYAQPDSRAEYITAQQDQKATLVKPEDQSKVERGMIWFRENGILERFAAGVGGFRPKFGGLAAGSGFGIGPEYQTTLGSLTLRMGAQSSVRGFRKFDFDIGVPRLSGGRFFAELYAVHHDYPSVSYYGPGPDSEKAGRTDFRFEDTAVDAAFGVRPIKHLSVGGSAGYVFNNVGPGTDSRYAQAEQIYTPAQAPGIDVQSNFVRTGVFAQYDWRDNPGGARKGGNYFVQFSDYRSFRRLDLVAQQFVSVLNQRRVFTVRARSTMMFRDGGEPIPFYMQPALGGSEDLRGYRPFRFRDENLFTMTAEYRWEVFSGLDMAVFTDAGRVYAHRSDFSVRHLETDAGFGFRFNARNQTFLRLDVGFSHEGFQVWVKFGDVFRHRVPQTSSGMENY